MSRNKGINDDDVNLLQLDVQEMKLLSEVFKSVKEKSNNNKKQKKTTYQMVSELDVVGGL